MLSEKKGDNLALRQVEKQLTSSKKGKSKHARMTMKNKKKKIEKTTSALGKLLVWLLPSQFMSLLLETPYTASFKSTRQ
jgi:hypothetical protein